MRAHAIPILEAAGVDLVLAGHDHVYERSFLMHGPHPGTWPTDAGRVISRTRGRRDEDGPYRKGGSAREGVVYAVVGSSGQTGPGSLDHPSMAVSLSVHGSLVIDVDGCSLDATFIDEDGEVRDRFALEKGAPCRSADTP